MITPKMHALLLVLALAATPAHAHDWYTKTGCCGGDDCRPYPCDLLEEDNRGGVTDSATGTYYDKTKVKASPNGECHICTFKGMPASTPYCVFILHGS
jgi:hypothetical protein